MSIFFSLNIFFNCCNIHRPGIIFSTLAFFSIPPSFTILFLKASSLTTGTSDSKPIIDHVPFITYKEFSTNGAPAIAAAES